MASVVTAVKNAFALSGASNMRLTTSSLRQSRFTTAYGAGLFQEPNSSSASLRISAASKSPTTASSPWEAP